MTGAPSSAAPPSKTARAATPPIATTAVPATLPLSTITARLAQQLADLADLSLVVQDALSLCQMEQVEPAALHGLQHLDLISQSLADHARVLRAIAQAVPTDLELDTTPLTTGVTRLDNRVQRLGCIVQDNPAETGGDVDWFDVSYL